MIFFKKKNNKKKMKDFGSISPINSVIIEKNAKKNMFPNTDLT